MYVYNNNDDELIFEFDDADEWWKCQPALSQNFNATTLVPYCISLLLLRLYVFLFDE